MGVTSAQMSGQGPDITTRLTHIHRIRDLTSPFTHRTQLKSNGEENARPA